MNDPVCHVCGENNVQLWGQKNDCDIYRCPICDLLFVFPIPKNLQEIYEESYFKNKDGGFGYTNYDRDKEPMREIFLSHLKKLWGLSSGKKILDVGAATGYFLDLAKSQGWQTAGTEISQFAAREASLRGHEMRLGLLPEISFTEKFDVITLWDVIEHLQSPREYLKAANNLLVPGGYIAINTPDASSLIAKILGLKWHLVVPPEHVYYFSPKNLGILLKQTGFEILESGRIGKKFSLPYVLNTLQRWSGSRLFSKIIDLFDKPYWRSFGIPINLHDNMFLLARKTISNETPNGKEK